MRAWPYGGGCSRITSSADPRRVSLLTLLDLPTIPPPTTPRCSRADLSLLSGLAIRTLCHPVCRDHGSRASPVPSRLATTTGRIEFVILRTGSSLSVALHLLSQGRSYLQLRGPDQPLQGLPPRRSNSITGALGRRSPSFSGSLWHDGPPSLRSAKQPPQPTTQPTTTQASTNPTWNCHTFTSPYRPTRAAAQIPQPSCEQKQKPTPDKARLGPAKARWEISEARK